MRYILSDNEKQHFIEVCNNSESMIQASRILGYNFNTFKRLAIQLDCYKTNQSGKGTHKNKPKKYSTKDILNNKCVGYGTYKLKARLIDEGYIEDKCSVCGWDKKPEGNRYTPCELHHIDGNNDNNNLSNLQLLCPNCHSLTKNYRFRKIRATNVETVS